MQIVIELTDEQYQTIEQSYPSALPDEFIDDVFNAISDGVNLPSEHGRLIDTDKLIDEYNKIGFYSDEIQALEESPTILEATR